MTMPLPSIRPHRNDGYDGGERWSEDRIADLEEENDALKEQLAEVSADRTGWVKDTVQLRERIALGEMRERRLAKALLLMIEDRVSGGAAILVSRLKGEVAELRQCGCDHQAAKLEELELALEDAIRHKDIAGG